ncbi:multiple ankyrin repeats single kh domain protein [Pyrenophora tritici-repentis]|uniref:Ankyrin repeat domain protein n=2 Tax=Pyrenophora tritici-repentis TaxID=45151 RepID=A0A2W1FC63_9PLEO|nr:uncharacterized protein PTRG_05536 [Pyrenophora tritici-repentis Pt-1C-BFP]KAA8618596.1 Ankyrin repeat-containing domain [Pyrenophora tritici-repentis]EDU48456.1 conserved hypothetical protein [Pyrenophora tritici-repentis Pt-1C-BFP]KAF7449070.1 Ankyrin repeat-containing domain [Pyrenophora tritici-repentis]KAF7570930.1 Pfs, NACHT and Ankyrin domain protein [Pyrenophora tritici-repentis]KAG9383990.1 Ankyrin repeat-containing domain [Pyrenophora tritici-repentis]
MVAGPHTSAFRLKHWITAGITDLPESEIDESSLEFRRHLLSVAAWIGDKSLVVKLVEEGCNHNDNPSMFLTPLRAASYRGHIDIVKFLMVDNSGDAPALRDRPLLIMSSAAHHNHTELIEIALDNSWHRGEVELTCIRNAMHSALRVTSDSETFTRLLQDADPPMTQYDKSGLLLNAAAQGKLAIVKHLIEREGIGSHGFDASVFQRRYPAELLKSSRYPSRYWNSLTCAVRTGEVDIVKVLLDSGAQLGHAIECAAAGGSKTLVRLLWEYGESKNAAVQGAFLMAVDREDTGMFKFLGELGATLDEDVRALLIKLAHESGLESMVNLLTGTQVH